MPIKKEISPLQTVQKDGDSLKKNVDSFMKEFDKHLKNTKRDPAKTKKLCEKCDEIRKSVVALTVRAQSLKPENEPIKTDRFPQQKQDELTRLATLKAQLDEAFVTLNGVDPEPVESEEEEESEEEGSEEEESETEVKGKMQQTSAKDDDEKQEEGSEGEDKEDAAAAEEGSEEEEEEEESEEGEEEESGEGEEEEESDEDEEHDGAEGQTTGASGDNAINRQYVVLADYTGEKTGDLTITKDEILTILETKEDGWWIAVNSKGKRGVVPVTFLKLYDKYKHVTHEDTDESQEEPETPRTPKSGKQLWAGIRSAVKETSVTDVLHVLGALPSGFRLSTLAKLKEQDIYQAKNYLIPKLSTSGVSFRDLFYDRATDGVRPRSERIHRIVSLVHCSNIPSPGTASDANEGIAIKSRHVRVCLFDGTNILSNIHTMRVALVEKDQKTWTFNTKVSDAMKSVEYGEFFVRSNTAKNNIGILFELCMSYTRVSTKEEGEFSCGWVNLPLFDEQGQFAPNKMYDLPVNGGTPYEKNVDVDANVGKRETANLLRSLMAANKQPRLTIRMNPPTKSQRILLSHLPDVLVSSTSYIHYMSLFRQVLVDKLLRNSLDLHSSEPIHVPMMRCFPDVVEQPDLMDVIRSTWAEKQRTVSRTNKKNQQALKDLFNKMFMETIYPLYYSSLPPFSVGDPLREQERFNIIQKILKLAHDKHSPAAMWLSPEVEHPPFNTSECGFSVVNPYCFTKVH